MRDWRTGLEDAIGQSAIFTGNHNRQFALRVTILRLSGPLVGYNTTIEAEARYELVDEAAGKIVYSRITDTTGYVSFDENHIGFARARDAVERAVRHNIEDFLADLQKIWSQNPNL